jgi:hypothetical protein
MYCFRQTIVDLRLVEWVTFEEEEEGMKMSSMTQWTVMEVEEEVEGGRCGENKDRGLMAAAAEYLRHCVGCTMGRRRS